ncbi:MAG TPA: NADH-quinone oxidoreductase subunit N [Desulfobaccales bacterium]|nr:NADH-quinone oxidoreductase subunit N [Desulfobaccales bacterium]
MATNWYALFPIITLSTGGLAIFMVGAFWRRRPTWVLFGLALLTAVGAGVVTLLLPPMVPGSGGLVSMGGYSRFFTLLLMFITIITLLFLRQYSLGHNFAGDELYAMLIFAALGMVLTAIGTNWVIFFLGLELMSLALYVLIAIRIGEPYSNEAGLKYFIMGAVASAFLTFGIGLVYAMTGTLQISGSMAAALTYPGHLSVILLGIGLIIVGVGFKTSLVPFHLWTADVYQGSPAPITAFLSTGSKVALFAALIRFAVTAAPSVWGYCWPVLWALAVLTMAVGNITALYQTHVKRILAYSSIGQMGYLFMTLVVVREGGLPALMFYLTIYAVMDLGAFGIVGTFSEGDADLEDLVDYQGLGYTHPWRSATLALCLLALAGLPPTAGLMGKLVLFRAVLYGHYYALAVIGMITVIISIYYYINVVIHLYMRERGGGTPVFNLDPAIGLAGAVIMAAILWLGIFPEPLLRVISNIVAVLPKFI